MKQKETLESMHLLSTGVVISQHHSWAIFWGWRPGVASMTLKYNSA